MRSVELGLGLLPAVPLPVSSVSFQHPQPVPLLLANVAAFQTAIIGLIVVSTAVLIIGN